MRIPSFLLVCFLLLLVGCSVGWKNPYITDEDEANRAFQRDSTYCEEQSQKADYDRRTSTYEACMDAKGWVKKDR